MRYSIELKNNNVSKSMNASSLAKFNANCQVANIVKNFLIKHNILLLQIPLKLHQKEWLKNRRNWLFYVHKTADKVVSELKNWVILTYEVEHEKNLCKY